MPYDEIYITIKGVSKTRMCINSKFTIVIEETTIILLYYFAPFDLRKVTKKLKPQFFAIISAVSPAALLALIFIPCETKTSIVS